MGTVNAIGLQEIKKFLADRHLNGGYITGTMLFAWAQDAEQKMADGNPPIIEIPSNWSVSGRPEQYEISPAGVASLETAKQETKMAKAWKDVYPGTVHEMRDCIARSIKSGATPMPTGASLTLIRQTWTAEQCKAYIDANALFECLPDASDSPLSGGQPSGSDADANALAAAIRAIAASAKQASPALDAAAVADIVRPLIADAVAAAQVMRVAVVSAPGRADVDLGVCHKSLPMLLKCISALSVKNVMLVGPSGSGKTHAAQGIAKALALDYYSMGACVLPSDLVGYRDAGGVYHDTQFARAYRGGGVVILDEIDSYAERASLALNEALSNGSAVFGGERVARHPDCIVIAGANTWGNGATLEFTGRARMDAALLGRFAVKLAWEYDIDLESAICGSPDLARKVQALRDKAKRLSVKIAITPRHTVAAADLVRAGIAEDDAIRMTALAGLPDADAKRLIGD